VASFIVLKKEKIKTAIYLFQINKLCFFLPASSFCPCVSDAEHVVKDLGDWNMRRHRTAQEQIRFKIVQGKFPTMLFNAKLFHMNAAQKTKVSIASVLVRNVEHKLGVKLQQNNGNVKILLNDQIVLFSFRIKYLVHLDLDLGSVIFPHQFDSPVHHVSTFISVSSPVPVS